MNDHLHYQGLSAEVYDEWHHALGDEDFYRRFIEGDGQPALECGCGTGRLLLPYLKSGLAVEGIDSSPEMLAILRAKAEAEGLSPVLHEASMQDLDLGKKYRTIYVPFRTFMVLSDRDVALRALGRFRDHLEEGGQLLISLFVVSYPITVEQNGRWRLQHRHERPDGSVLMISEAVTNDLVEQVKSVRFRYEVFEAGRLVRTELQEFDMRFYFRYEFEMMLEKAGFTDIFAHGDFSDEPVRSGHGEMTFRAVRG